MPLRHRARVEPEVDEPRPRDLRRRETCRTAIDGVDQSLREVARLLAERLGEHHGEVRRPIAERGIARTLEHGTTSAGAPSETAAREISRRSASAPALTRSLLGFGGALAGLGSAGFDSAFCSALAPTRTLFDDSALLAPSALGGARSLRRPLPLRRLWRESPDSFCGRSPAFAPACPCRDARSCRSR